MRIYFSGESSGDSIPEILIPKHRPHIMLTFYQLYHNGSAPTRRLKAHLRRLRNEDKSRRIPKRS
jgi:hypothetical protein